MTKYRNLIVSAFLAQYDSEEMIAIIERFLPLIRKYQRKLGGDEDIKQEMILTLIEAIHKCSFHSTYMREAFIVSYLAKALYYKYATLCKRLKRNQLIYLEDHPEIFVSIEDQSDIYFKEILHHLSKTQQAILYLKYYLCFTDVEIAKILKITAQGVGQARRRALEKLRHKI